MQLWKYANMKVWKYGNLPMTNEEGEDYAHLDDSGRVIKTQEGLIIISGCAHSGICNTVEYAKNVTGDNRIISVIGGFHLKQVDERTLKTIEYMKNNSVKKYIFSTLYF